MISLIAMLMMELQNILINYSDNSLTFIYYNKTLKTQSISVKLTHLIKLKTNFD